MAEQVNDTRLCGPEYITKAVRVQSDGSLKIITSRRHRKGRGSAITSVGPGAISQKRTRNPWIRFWAPHRLTWWVAVLFFTGSLLFSLGGYATTFPLKVPHPLNQNTVLTWIFFTGSIFFKSATFCQLLEAINAGEFVLGNSNLLSYLVALTIQPTPDPDRHLS